MFGPFLAASLSKNVTPSEWPSQTTQLIGSIPMGKSLSITSLFYCLHSTYFHPSDLVHLLVYFSAAATRMEAAREQGPHLPLYHHIPRLELGLTHTRCSANAE